MGHLPFCRRASAAVTEVTHSHAGLAPGASGADSADGAWERTGDAGSSCSGIQCALRIRQGEERCHWLRDVIVEPCCVCRLGRLRVRLGVRCKHRRVWFHRRVCTSESVSRATAIRAQLTLGYVLVLKSLRLRDERGDVHHRVCTPTSAPSAAAACTWLTLYRHLELGYRPHRPARLRKGLPGTHVSRPTRPRAPAQAQVRAAACKNVCVSTHSGRRRKTRTRVVRGCGLHKLRRGRGCEQLACANARVSKRAGPERRIRTSDSEIE
jgi:hypothetical protein